MLAIEYRQDGAVVVVGRLDAAQSQAAQAFLDKVQGDRDARLQRARIHLERGLGVLLKTQKRLLASRRQAAARGAESPLRDIFTIPASTRLFEIESAG
jgi:hypothetical protein